MPAIPAQVHFSISTPIGAYHPLLPYCLESLRRQQAPVSIALLDASGDPRVLKLADEFRDVVAYCRHGRDAGQAAAIREGWERTEGDVLGWLNADDLLYPGALAAVAARFAQDPGADVVYGHSAICDLQMRMTGYHWAVSPDTADLARGCNISQPSCFFRRRAYEAVGGLNAALHYTMDWDLWLRLQAGGARFVFVDEPLSAVFWGEGTKTSEFNAARRRELSRLIDRYAPESIRSKVFRGFAVQAALDMLRPVSLQRFARRTLLRNRQRVFGVGPDGAVDGTATISWFHLESEPKSILRIACEQSKDLVAKTCRPLKGVDREAGGVSIRFTNVVEAGETVFLELTQQGGDSWRFLSAEWRS